MVVAEERKTVKAVNLSDFQPRCNRTLLRPPLTVFQDLLSSDVLFLHEIQFLEPMHVDLGNRGMCIDRSRAII